MKSTFSVIYYLKRQVVKKDGTVPVMGRITVDGSQTQFSCKLTVDPKLWDTKGGRVTGRSTAALETNRMLDKMRVRINRHYQEIMERDNFVTAEKVKNAFLGLEHRYHTLMQVFRQHNEDYEKQVEAGMKAKGTLLKYRTVYKHMQEFLDIRYHVKDIALKELTPAFISDFEMFLRTDKHCCTNTVWLYVCPLRTMVFIAINNEWLTRDPFREYEIKKEETTRSFLTKDEIRLLMEGKLKNAKQELYRDLYLFCAFTGLSFADMRNLTEENIRTYFDEHEWININRQKTGVVSNIRLLDIANRIIGKARVIMRNGKYPAVPAQSPVFADYAVGDVEQADVGHHARLLAVDVYPLVFVKVGTDVVFRQIPHVGERQARECAEQVEVAVQLLLGILQLSFHQQADFVFRQETACRFLLLDFILAERIACEPLVVDGDEHHRAQGADVQPHGIGAAVLVRAQEHFKVGNESGRKLLQRDVLHVIADSEELLQVLVNGPVFQERALGFHARLHLFLVVLIVPAEHLHQRVVAVFQSEKGVLHLLRRDEVVTLHDFLIVLVDAHAHLVEHTVRFESRRASARDTSRFGVPQLGIDRQLTTELCLASVHCDASHDGNCPVLFHYLTFEVVDN